MPDTVTSLSIADSRTYSISELAREFGIAPRALRFYEDKDMLHPARDGMTRVYSHRDRGRVKIIVRLKRLGLPLADIREILDLYGLEDGQRAQMRMSLVKFQNQIKELESQREDIEMALQELHRGIEVNIGTVSFHWCFDTVLGQSRVRGMARAPAIRLDQ